MAWIATPRNTEKRKGTFNWRKIEKPGGGHSASRMFAAKEVGDALFGSPVPNRLRRGRHTMAQSRLHTRTQRNLARNPSHPANPLHPLACR